MRRISGRLAGGGAFLLLALACNPEKPVGPQSPTFDAAETLVAPLVLHTVAPQTTDPAIDRALDNHYVWLDTTAKLNHKLFVFLPGTGQTPDRKSTRLNSSHLVISYAVFCLKKKKKHKTHTHITMY